MDNDYTNTGYGDDNAETAAPKVKAATTKNPITNLSRALLRLTSTSYETFRHCVAATFFNSQVQEALGTTEIQPLLLTSLDGFTSPPTKAALLRDRVALKPGDGKKNPIVLEFYEYVRLPREVMERLTAANAVPAGLFADRVEILEYLTKMEAMGQTANQQKILDADREALEDKLGYVLYNGFLKTYISVRQIEEGMVQTLEFKVSTEMDPGVYANVIKAEDFSSYLVHLWVHTAMSPKYQGGIITDPRIVARQSANMQNRFGSLKAKTDERSFGVYANGMPIYIPPSVGEPHLSAFMDKADMCVDDDGYYSKQILVETHNQHNKVVYVDWLNDIMAYTSSTGTLHMVNLGDVVALDKATEYSFLDTPINGGVKNKIIQTIMFALDRSLDNISPAEALEFAEDDDTRREISSGKGAAVHRIEAMNTGGVTVGGKGVAITLLHFAGQNFRELYGNDLGMLVPRLRAYRCYVKAWVAKRAATKDDKLVYYPAGVQGQNVLWRLQGFEYIVHTINKMNDAVYKDLSASWLDEKRRQASDANVREFDIPNVHVGKGGLEGLLPHQGRILSSKAKVPHTSIDPVSTGGGKTILSIVDLLLALKDNPNIRGLITTKGRLVKGTITEINAITKGKVNAIPLRSIVLFRMAKFAGVNTFEKLQTWFKSLPPNTVFVNAYSDYTSKRAPYPDLETVNNFANMGLHDKQYLAVIKLLGFDMVVGDESHMIKNPDASRSTASYSVFTRADKRRITSGTIVSNTVKDVIGQARAITPAIFGTNVDAFAEMYDVSTGLIQDDETAELIVERMKAFSGYHEATREDWSYMLPTLLDRISFSELTPLQAEYYSICMREAELELLRLAESKEKVSGDDDDDDEEDDDEDTNEEEAAEEAFIEQAKFVLQKVEMFLVSPETDERYINWKVPDAPENHPKPSGRDLISPKIGQMDVLIKAHLERHRGALASNKIIVFGVNKVASQHFMRHSQYAGNAIHYTAGNEEAVRLFATDPNQFLLVADETALREGENLQMVSLILRQQAVWSPGDHEQANARMYRPDPRGRYNRENVEHVWCMTRLPNGQPTLDGIKVARLSSKTVSNARMVYYKNPSWRRISTQFEDLSMLRMNPETLFKSTMDDMAPYWDAWSTFNAWEGQNNLAAKRRAAQALQAKHPDEDFTDAQGNITDINTFVRLAMFKVTSSNDLPGSKRVYCPWVINAIPPDPKGYGFEIVGRRMLPLNTVVLCEYGPAIVEKVKEGRAIIYTLRLSNGAKMNIPGGAVAAVIVTADNPATGQRYAEFAKIVKNPTAWAAETYFPIQTVGVTKPSAGRAAKSNLNPEDIEELTDDDLTGDLNAPEPIEPEELDLGDLDDLPDNATPELDVIAGIVNTMPALIVKDDLQELNRVKDWHRIDPYVSVKFRTWEAVQATIDALYNGNNVHMSDEVYDALTTEMEYIRTGKTLQVGSHIDNSKLRNFLTDQRKKLGVVNGKIVVKPYFLVFDLEVRLAFDIDSHAPAIIKFIVEKLKLKIPGVVTATRHPAMWINTFRNGAEVRKDLAELMKVFNIVDVGQVNSEIDDVMEQLKTLARPRRRTF